MRVLALVSIALTVAMARVSRIVPPWSNAK
jgi:hypothetical protein